jgi:hypothetical protein
MIANDFSKYAVQLNIYAYIAWKDYNVDFRESMYVLQVHPNLKQPHLAKVPNLQDKMALIFAAEEAAALQKYRATAASHTPVESASMLPQVSF